MIKIPPGGILIMLSAQDTAHAACLSASDAKLKATPANIAHALKKGQVSIARLQQAQLFFVGTAGVDLWTSFIAGKFSLTPRNRRGS